MNDIFISENMFERAEARIKQLKVWYKGRTAVFKAKRGESLAFIIRSTGIVMTPSEMKEAQESFLRQLRRRKRRQRDAAKREQAAKVEAGH